MCRRSNWRHKTSIYGRQRAVEGGRHIRHPKMTWWGPNSLPYPPLTPQTDRTLWSVWICLSRLLHSSGQDPLQRNTFPVSACSPVVFPHCNPVLSSFTPRCHMLRWPTEVRTAWRSFSTTIMCERKQPQDYTEHKKWQPKQIWLSLVHTTSTLTCIFWRLLVKNKTKQKPQNSLVQSRPATVYAGCQATSRGRQAKRWWYNLWVWRDAWRKAETGHSTTRKQWWGTQGAIFRLSWVPFKYDTGI